MIGQWLLDHGVDPCLPVVDSVLPLDDESLFSVAIYRANLRLAELFTQITADC